MQRDQRRPAGSDDVSFVLDKSHQHRNHCREHREGPGGPTGFPSLDDRIDQQEQTERCQSDTDEIKRDVVGATRLPDHPGYEGDRDEANRNIDQKDRSPGPAEQVQADEQPAQKLRGDRGKAHRCAIQADRDRALRCGELHSDDGEDLRCHGGGTDRLRDTGCNQRFGSWRQPAECRGDREAADPDQKDPLSPKYVTQPPARDEGHPEGDAVGGDDELQLRGARAQTGPHRRQGDVNDKEVEEGEERADQDNGERSPSPRIKAGGLVKTGRKCRRRYLGRTRGRHSDPRLSLTEVPYRLTCGD